MGWALDMNVKEGGCQENIHCFIAMEKENSHRGWVSTYLMRQ